MALGRELSPASLVKLTSFIFWGGLYIYTALNYPKKSPEWCSRFVTLIHAIVATIVGLYQCGVTTLSTCRLNMKISMAHYALMVWSWGYFAFDLLWCLLNSEPPLILVHHVSALVGISLYMYKDYTGCTFACNLAMLEVTNPLLQTRWFLRYEGHEKTMSFFLVEVCYLVMFISVRGVLGTYILYRILKSDMFDNDEKVLSVAIYAVSIGLLYQIMGFLIHRYKARVVVFLDDMGIILNDPD